MGPQARTAARDPLLTQEEIDRMFSGAAQRASRRPAPKVELYDVRRADRMPRDQLRTIRQLHENFSRALGASLSAYLRAYVSVTLISLEQISYREFSQTLASPTVLMLLEMAPFEGNALLEINPALAFPILEIALGGSGKNVTVPDREITEIEANVLRGVCRILLNDLQEAWRMITEIDFRLLRHETEPQMVQFLAPNEAVVAVCMEAKLAEHTGTINLAVPSLIIKMLRQKFAERASVRHRGSVEDEQRMFDLVQEASLTLDVRLEAGPLRLQEILKLAAGDVIAFDHPIERPIRLTVNSVPKFDAQLIDRGGKRAARIR